VPFAQTIESDKGKRARNSFSPFRSGDPSQAKWIRHVFGYAQMRPNGIRLKYHPHVPSMGLYKGVRDRIRYDAILVGNASGVGSLEARDHAKRRRFAATAWPEQRENLAPPNL
jgi:hypothetical protein